MQVFMQPLENLKEFEEITQKLPKNGRYFAALRLCGNSESPYYVWAF